MWAFVATGREPPVLLVVIAEVAEGRLNDFNSHDHANKVWAFAAAGHASQLLCGAMSQVAKNRLEDFSCRALANTV